MSPAVAPVWANRIVGQGTEDPGQLLANPLNWRIHPKAQQDALAGLLDTVGWVQNVIVNRRSGHVVDGHLRVTLALRREEPQVPVVYVDLSPEDEALVLASLDPLAQMAVTDKEMLARLLADVHAEGALGDMLGMGAAPGLTDPDVAPPPPADPYVRRGQLYRLGEHRILCGDATSAGDMARLMGDRKARMVWTDPPYGVDYIGKTADALTITNDARNDTDPLLRDAFAVLDAHLVDGAAIYVASPAGRQGVVFAQAFMDAGWLLHQTLVWVKNSIVVGHSDYHYQHELVLYGWRKGAQRDWWGFRDQASLFDDEPRIEDLTVEELRQLERVRREQRTADVLREKRPGVSALHPTMKPVPLIRRMVENSSGRGDLIVDIFGGSGSTLIAAQQLGRRCYAMELDPRYAQVAIERWESFTGQKAVLDG